jgi:hypothetical protein
MIKIQASNIDSRSNTGGPDGGASTSMFAAGPRRHKGQGMLRFTPSQWRAILESRGFLDRPDNCFQHPRRFLGSRVQIIPDESFR